MVSGWEKTEVGEVCECWLGLPVSTTSPFESDHLPRPPTRTNTHTHTSCPETVRIPAHPARPGALIYSQRVILLGSLKDFWAATKIPLVSEMAKRCVCVWRGCFIYKKKILKIITHSI